MPKRDGFVYKPRGKDAVNKRANQSGGAFDSMFNADFAVFSPKEGDYAVRFLPPTWEDAEHFGLELFVHYGVGSDNQSYLCLEKMCGKPCPICEQRSSANRDGDAEYAKSLAPVKRVLVWLIDREAESVGPQLWSMPWTVDRDIANLSIEKHTGEVLLIDDPDSGYDVEFNRSGTGIKTKYNGIKIARKSTVMSVDADDMEDWLQFVVDNPLTGILQYYSYDRIAAAASGGAIASDTNEDDQLPTRSRAKLSKRDQPFNTEEDEDLPPVRSRSRAPAVTNDDEDDDLPTSTPSSVKSRSKVGRVMEEEPEEDDYACVACSDTGRTSKGGYCVCETGRALKNQERNQDDSRPAGRTRSR